MWVHFTNEARRAILAAQTEAERDGRAWVTPAHLLLGALDCSAELLENNVALNDEIQRLQPVVAVLLDASKAANSVAESVNDETDAARIIELMNADPQLLRLAIQARLRALPPVSSRREPKLSPAAKRALEFAADEARRLKSPRIGSEHLLLGVARPQSGFQPFDVAALWMLLQVRLISQETWLRARRSNLTVFQVLFGRAASDVYVADVLAEFDLDLASLRLAAAGLRPDSEVPKWTNEGQRLVERAVSEARATGAGRIGAEHLWLGMLVEQGSAARTLLDATEVDVAILEKHLRQSLLSDNETSGAKPRYTAEAKRAFENATATARRARCHFMGSDHLLLALVGVESAPENAVARVQKTIAGEAASRADAAIVRALAEQHLAADYLREKLSPASRKKPQLHGADVVTQVTHIIAEELKMPFEEVTAETNLVRGENSHLVLLDILQRCAREFGVSFSPDEAKEIRTASNVANTVIDKLAMQKKVAVSKAFTSLWQKNRSDYLMFYLPFGMWAIAYSSTQNMWTPLLLVAIAGIVVSTPGVRQNHTERHNKLRRLYLIGTGSLILLIVFIGSVSLLIR